MNNYLNIYIAGPMTGIPKFNYPAFFDAERILNYSRPVGGGKFKVFKPMDWMTTREISAAMANESGTGHAEFSYEQALLNDFKILLTEDIRAIALLPGWQASRGAKIEVFIGLSTSKVFYNVDIKGVQKVTPTSTAFVLKQFRTSLGG